MYEPKIEEKNEINIRKKDIYLELYNSDNPNFFKNDIAFYISIGIKNAPFEDDLVIPISRSYLNNNIRQFFAEYILDNNEDTIIESLQLGDILNVDSNLRQRLKKTFNSIKELLIGKQIKIYSEPIDLGPEWQKKGTEIKEKEIDLNSKIIDNVMYVEINDPEEGYHNVKQYMARFELIDNERIYEKAEKADQIRIKSSKIKSSKKDTSILELELELEFEPIEIIIDYEPDKSKLMKIPTVRKRIEERKKWLPYSDDDLFYLIFAPIRFLRFKHMQNRLTTDYIDGDKHRPSIVKDIRQNSLLGGVWEYKDIEFLAQIDMLIEKGIIVPTDFNYYSPPYSILYKAIKNGTLMVGGIPHHLEGPKEEYVIKDGIKEKIIKPGHFITYTCMKRMGSEGTQVVIKYQNDIGTTSKMLTCQEMDMEMADADMDMKDKDKEEVKNKMSDMQ